MKHKIIKQTLLAIGISLSIANSQLSIAQRSLGTSGLLNIPSADMQEDGTFMAGGNYLPEEMLPREWGYNSGNYFVNLTFLPFMEVAYRCTLLKVREYRQVESGPLGFPAPAPVEGGEVVAVGRGRFERPADDRRIESFRGFRAGTAISLPSMPSARSISGSTDTTSA